MSILRIIKRLPDYSQGLKNNLIELFSGDLEGLSKKQILGIALTIAYYMGQETLLNDIRSEAKIYLDEIEATMAKLAVINMSMEIAFYGYTKNSNDHEIRSVKLAMQNDIDIEVEEINMIDMNLYSFAIAILSSSKASCEKYTELLLKQKITNEGLVNVARVVAVLKAVLKVLKMQELRSYDFIAREPSF